MTTTLNRVTADTTLNRSTPTTTLNRTTPTATINRTTTTTTLNRTASVTLNRVTPSVTLDRSTAGATLIAGVHTLPATPVPVVGALKIAGHSYLPDTVSYIDDDDDGLARTLRRAFGTRPEGYHNMAVAGGAVSDHSSSSSWSKVVADTTPSRTFPYSADCGLAIVSYGTNDAILGTATNERTGYKESLKTVWSRLCAAATFDNDSSTISGGANWTNTAHGATEIGGGSGNWVSSTVGAILTITVPSDFEGGYVGLIFPGAYAGGTATIKVDGATVGTVTTGNMHSSNYSSKFAATTFRTNIATPGAHTITVTVASQINSGSVYFNGWHIEASPSPMIAMLENVTPSSPGGVWAGIDADRQAAYNGYLDTAMTDFNAASTDNPVFLVELEALLDADDAYFATDGLHPNARGAALMAAEVYEAVAARLRHSLATTKQLTAYWGDADPEVSYDWLRSDWDVHAWVDDTFTRDDDATSLGTGESGHTWTTTGTLGISSNQAYMPSGSTRTFATVDTGSPDGEWTVDVDNNGSSDQKVGAILRFVDSSNYISLECFPSFVTMGLYIYRNGTATLLDNTGFSGTAGEFRCVMQGNTITVYDAGVEACTVTDDRLLELRSSKHGMFFANTTGRIGLVYGQHYTPVLTDWVSNHSHLRAVTGAYTLVLADNDRVIEANSSSPFTITVPTSTVRFPVGAHVDVVQVGSGAVTIAGDTGVNVRTSSTLVLSQYQRGTLLKRSSTEWIFSKWS